MPRILLITRVITAYRIPLYRDLARLDGWDFLVAHGRQTSEAGVSLADQTKDLPFRTTVLRNLERRIGPVTLRWQAGVLGAIWAFSPDVLIVSSEIGTVSNLLVSGWARLHGRSIIAWTSAWEPHARRSLASRLKRRLTRLYFRLTDYVLVYSTRAKGDVVASGVDAERVCVCHNGIDVTGSLAEEPAIRATASRLRGDLDLETRPVFLYVGRMTAEKAVDLLISAFAESSASKKGVLWLVGDGPNLPDLKALVVSAHIPNVRFWGRVMDGVDAYFAAADWFVLPGLGGLALNQAMMFGVPCVCSMADGTEDDLIIHGETGLRFLPGDKGSLIHALDHATNLFESGGGLGMGDAARKLVLKTSTVGQMVKTFDEVIERALGTHTSR